MDNAVCCYSPSSLKLDARVISNNASKIIYATSHWDSNFVDFFQPCIRLLV